MVVLIACKVQSRPCHPCLDYWAVCMGTSSQTITETTFGACIPTLRSGKVLMLWPSSLLLLLCIIKASPASPPKVHDQGLWHVCLIHVDNILYFPRIADQRANEVVSVLSSLKLFCYSSVLHPPPISWHFTCHSLNPLKQLHTQIYWYLNSSLSRINCWSLH